MKIFKKSRMFHGFSFYFCVGRNKGFKILEKDGPSIRITLGGLSFCIGFVDIERVFRRLLDELSEKDKKFEKIEEKETSIEFSKNHLEETIEKLNDDISDLKSVEEENESLKSKNEELEEKIDDLSCEISDLEEITNSISEVEEEALNLRSKIRELESEIRDLEDLNDDAVEELYDSYEEYSEAINDLLILENEALEGDSEFLLSSESSESSESS